MAGNAITGSGYNPSPHNQRLAAQTAAQTAASQMWQSQAWGASGNMFADPTAKDVVMITSDFSVRKIANGFLVAFRSNKAPPKIPFMADNEYYCKDIAQVGERVTGCLAAEILET